MKKVAIYDQEFPKLKEDILEFSRKLKLELIVETYIKVDHLITVLQVNPRKYDMIFMRYDSIQDVQNIMNLNPNVHITLINEIPLEQIGPYEFIQTPIKTEIIFKILEDYFFKENPLINIPLTSNKIHSVRVQSIKYIESTLRKIRIYYEDGTEDYYYSKLSTIIKLLPRKHFIQCHQSFIVNFNKIRRINKTVITLTDGTIIPLSRRHKKEVSMAFHRHQMME